MKRFLNADAFASTGQGFLGFNMFAYCENNPTICTDSDGHSPFQVLYSLWKLFKSLLGEETNTFFSNSEISVTVSPDSVVFEVYMTFDGDIAKEELEHGITDYWNGTYDIAGKTRTVSINIHSGSTKDGRSIYVHSFNDNGRSNTTSTWRGAETTTVTMYQRYEKGEAKNVRWSMAHEFGHCLGVGDYYKYVDSGIPGYKRSFLSIMNGIGTHAQSCDIIKAILASALGQWQTWSPE